MKNLLVSYVLAAVGLISPLAGLHRFYLNKPISGIFYVITWGFLGIGTIIDLIRMPDLVDMANHPFLGSPQQTRRMNSAAAEQQILKIASRNQGNVTPQMVAMQASFSLSHAKKELDRLKNEGYCTVDIDEDGAEVYHFTGLSPKKPLEFL